MLLWVLPTPPLATTKPDARQLIATTKQTALNDKIAHRNGSAADERRVEAVSAVFRIILPYARVVMGDIFPSGDTFFLSTDTPDSDILLFFGYFSRNMRCINISFHNKKNNNSEHCYSLISLCVSVCVFLFISHSLFLFLSMILTSIAVPSIKPCARTIRFALGENTHFFYRHQPLGRSHRLSVRGASRRLYPTKHPSQIDRLYTFL